MLSLNQLSDKDFITEARYQLKEARKNVSSSRMAFKNLKIWVDKRVNKKAYEEDSAINVLKTAFDNSGNVNKMNDEDLYYAVDALSEFLDSITVDDIDESGYEINANLSNNLQILLGKGNSNISNNCTIDWKAPSTYGLSNSDPIIKTKGNTVADSKSTGNDENERKSDKSEDSGDDDDDQDDEEDENYDADNDIDEDELIARMSVHMSSSLKNALGMKTEQTKTDWKPPERSGLDNSRPLVNSDSKLGLYENERYSNLLVRSSIDSKFSGDKDINNNLVKVDDSMDSLPKGNIIRIESKGIYNESK